jgi:hypothetical protein
MGDSPSPLLISSSSSPERGPAKPAFDVASSMLAKAVIAIVAGYASIRLLGLLHPVSIILLESALLMCALTPPENWLVRAAYPGHW